MNENFMKRKVLWKTKGGSTGKERKPAGHSQAVWRALMTVGAIMGAVLLVGAMAAPLCAQSYPTKPIRLIIPFAPGGGTDMLGRLLGQKLAERLGQPVVPENHPGASSMIASELVAKARPDGYTILFATSALSISPSLSRKSNYDPIKDFAPISLLVDLPFVLLVRPSLPVNSLKEFVEYAKANPGKLNYATTGVGGTPHLTSELIKIITKINIVHVPYKGGGQAMIGLVGGEVDMFLGNVPISVSLIQDGRVRALAVLSGDRLPELPNVPTAKEAGIDNCEVSTLYGILAPAGTPRDIINRLNAEWIRIKAMPDIIEKFQKAGFNAVSSTPEQYSELIKSDVARWAKVIKEANISKID